MAIEPRSWLFIPGDSAKKIAKIGECGADAVIIDLEDSVVPSRKDAARELAARAITDLGGPDAPALWVRINPLTSAFAEQDLAAIVPMQPAGIVLPKAEGAESVRRLSALLDEIAGAGSDIGIHAIATETARAVVLLDSFADNPSARLAALSWGAEDLASDLGASASRDEAGTYFEPFRLARARMLFAAHACKVQAVEGLHPDYRDENGLRRTSVQAMREGFTGRLAIHPAQVPVINAAFLPAAADVELSARIVAAFADEPDAGTIGLDGRMFDRPHLLQAQRLLARHAAFAG